MVYRFWWGISRMGFTESLIKVFIQIDVHANPFTRTVYKGRSSKGGAIWPTIESQAVAVFLIKLCDLSAYKFSLWQFQHISNEASFFSLHALHIHSAEFLLLSEFLIILHARS